MTKAEIEHLFDPRTFSPVVLTAKDGFALPISDAHNVLVGLRMIVVKFENRIYHFPFHSIAHISEQGENLG